MANNFCARRFEPSWFRRSALGIRSTSLLRLHRAVPLLTFPGDDVVEAHGVSVYVDPKAVLFLLGSTMDFEATKLRTGFTFKNPNEVSACGCGESVMLKPAAERDAAAAAH